MPIIINELAATIRPEPQTVARDTSNRPAPAMGAAELVFRQIEISRERETRLVID